MTGPIVSREERAIERARRRGLKIEHDPLGWWVMDYRNRRGDAPTVVAGPFQTKDGAERAR